MYSGPGGPSAVYSGSMSHRHFGEDLSRGFLTGAPCCVDEIRDGVQTVVRCFHPVPDGLNEDLVQDVLMRVVHSLRSGRFRGESSLRTYAQHVAKFACLEQRRSRRFQVELDADAIPSPDYWSSPDANLLDEEEQRHNLAVFASMSSESRELFRLIFVECLSYREVGERLGITEAAIKSRVHRMRAFLLERERARQDCEGIAPSVLPEGSR